ncbi:polysaccharide pyruvyl transferase [Rhizobium sp. PDO1-076]|uniref:polysaccharide pyruvyl transferase family protein n=1 Tax=Rhizobium sp. PDO1-076 TaxID=1125979 RepID=UPI00024E39CF|nr:polysaccharide pyruvyl transferase family protein [Rhizobium sp. PDO1-076]EHS49489.1 polysaccharide pyruvyl transferase [Rhizobium sp. PDO1-076]
MRVVVFNVKYSENLGDGLLAQCLETALSDYPDMQVETIDLAGRTGFGTTHSRRQLAIHALHVLPAFARRLAVKAMLRSKLEKLAKDWSIKIDNADAVVVGGGNLFQDDDLNFPLKIGTLLDCIRKSGKPVAIYAVGVSGHWSTEACKLFGRLGAARVVHLSVRDDLALRHWKQHFPSGGSPIVLPDPGLLTCSLPHAARGGGSSRVSAMAGICVTDPVILQRHSGGPASDIALKTVDEYRALIRQLIADGYRIRLFCNGAREDQAFAERLLKEKTMQAYKASNWLSLAVRPERPEELIDILRSVSVVLAHRLHACIAAYSLAIPHVGLGWDPKVASFFTAVGRDAFFAAGPSATPAQIASLIKTAEDDSVGDLRREATLAAAAAGIETLYAALSFIPPPTSRTKLLVDSSG